MAPATVHVVSGARDRPRGQVAPATVSVDGGARDRPRGRVAPATVHVVWRPRPSTSAPATADVYNMAAKSANFVVLHTFPKSFKYKWAKTADIEKSHNHDQPTIISCSNGARKVVCKCASLEWVTIASNRISPMSLHVFNRKKCNDILSNLRAF